MILIVNMVGAEIFTTPAQRSTLIPVPAAKLKKL